MSITKHDARGILHDQGLRATAPRVAVLRVLAEAERPLSHSEVVERLGDADWDQATIYRNLVKLEEAGLARIASRVEGIDRYALATSPEDRHLHPHFVCEDCGRIACLPAELIALSSTQGAWTEAIQGATVQFQGECPDCRARGAGKRK